MTNRKIKRTAPIGLLFASLCAGVYAEQKAEQIAERKAEPKASAPAVTSTAQAPIADPAAVRAPQPGEKIGGLYTTPVPAAPSTVKAVYVDPSAARTLQPGEKIGGLYARNTTQDYVLQRLTQRTYWVQSQHYGTVFHVGDKGVLLFDALEGKSRQIKQAIAEVTKLPISALVYSHGHADHIGDAKIYVEDAAKAGVKLRVIASTATAAKMAFLKSALPKPTETVAWPSGAFKFEGLTVALHGFERAAHTDDHGIWLLSGEKVAHLPDLINPDQPPFWAFAGSETFVYYEANLEQLAKLDWTYLSGGHGNVGSKADIGFYRTFIADLKLAVGKALGEVSWGVGVDASKTNAHTPFLPAWLNAVAKHATDQLRPKYGQYYGFEAATPRNAEMVAFAMSGYK
jgi:glyoxylase-like metal-dependent hydrolase (beta-lactamase superfamily II)